MGCPAKKAPADAGTVQGVMQGSHGGQEWDWERQGSLCRVARKLLAAYIKWCFRRTAGVKNES